MRLQYFDTSLPVKMTVRLTAEIDLSELALVNRDRLGQSFSSRSLRHKHLV